MTERRSKTKRRAVVQAGQGFVVKVDAALLANRVRVGTCACGAPAFTVVGRDFVPMCDACDGAMREQRAAEKEVG